MGWGRGKPPPCFLKGTLLRTPDGDRKIEDLRIDDLVIIASGEAKPIRSTWRQRYQRYPGKSWDLGLVPVRVARSALGTNIPSRDLFLSPGHCLYVAGVLVPAIDLLNDLTIARHSAEDLSEIEYFHIKLERHSVIYAEDAPCETMQTLARVKAERRRDGPVLMLEEPTVAPRLSYCGGKGMLRGRIRSAISPVIDVRTELDVMRDELEARALVIRSKPPEIQPQAPI